MAQGITKNSESKNGNGQALGFETTLWATADKLRGNLDAAEYKHVVLGLIFSMSDWGGDRLRKDVRWKFGLPPSGNANYAWVQHFIHHLASHGVAGSVLANGNN